MKGFIVLRNNHVTGLFNDGLWCGFHDFRVAVFADRKEAVKYKKRGQRRDHRNGNTAVWCILPVNYVEGTK